MRDSSFDIWWTDKIKIICMHFFTCVHRYTYRCILSCGKILGKKRKRCRFWLFCAGRQVNIFVWPKVRISWRGGMGKFTGENGRVGHWYSPSNRRYLQLVSNVNRRKTRIRKGWLYSGRLTVAIWLVLTWNPTAPLFSIRYTFQHSPASLFANIASPILLISIAHLFVYNLTQSCLPSRVFLWYALTKWQMAWYFESDTSVMFCHRTFQGVISFSNVKDTNVLLTMLLWIH